MKILVVNGPNLGRLGMRDKELYGAMTLRELNELVSQRAIELGVETEFYQSNHEGFIIDRLEKEDFDALIINPGALSHYGYSLRDAVAELKCHTVEVHLSDITKREPFRSVRILENVVEAVFYGEKEQSYLKAVEWVIKKYNEKS